ncbi:unnamed protein product [Didymodactylos carnosus]|uniref:G-protein coupled receptors family 1 profile domain-containing protein n=1 Tax=Didymodactylos carnosus TaxID=1234261 RepID=A0A814BEU4_9BILA|nr:unnamed protein product [Didymodactylos carnosus]CAF1031685.1 unnamed protein product [Didymodactylos carnosus]CAF3704358.1 unnamed protein product [Didymodactylos carnosus]CAF3799887.1 unnamed protein product [Didymodactylos carnosus]
MNRTLSDTTNFTQLFEPLVAVFPQRVNLDNSFLAFSLDSSTSSGHMKPALESHPLMMTTFISLYTLIFFFGISGNFLVVLVVCRNKTMQTVTNVFITNLAFSDILMCCLAVPFTAISAYVPSWHLGRILCHIVPMSLGISVYVSTLTSLAIAVDRYFVIVHPFRSRMRLGVCILLIIVIWIVGISISLPLAIYMRFDKGKCGEYWPQHTSRRFFNFSSLILQYLIPFSVISFSYYKVWLALARRRLPGRTRVKEEIEICRKKRTNRMLIAMVVIFAICWLPLNIVHMVSEFHRQELKNNYTTLFLTTHVIAMSSTIYNPFLYAWLNDNFRKEFQQIVPWFFKLFVCCNNQRTLTVSEGEYYDRPSTFQLPPESTMATGLSAKKDDNLHMISEKENGSTFIPKAAIIATLDKGKKLKKFSRKTSAGSDSPFIHVSIPPSSSIPLLQSGPSSVSNNETSRTRILPFDEVTTQQKVHGISKKSKREHRQ